MKKFFKDWNIFEILILVIGISLIVVCFIIEKEKNILSFITSIIGVVSVLFVAKGLTIAPIIDIVFCILYALVSYFQKYYGEAIIYIAMMMPISLFSIFSWFKNKSKTNENFVKINKIKGMEYLYLTFATIVLTIGFYFLLKALNTSQLIVSTISLITSVVASYLMLRRCSYYAIGFMLNDIILIILWSMAIVESGWSYLPTVLSFCVFFINDLYGFIHWKIQEKKQDNDIALYL
ncbi:MAG: nicotinamide mononucleotide transporter [Clostridia bacterium]|nr:nicotinamide mononucleotide transporter [Clostridia bacterium]